MSRELNKAFPMLSRRFLLRYAAAAGVLGATSNLVEAQPKVSKVAVNYQDHPDGNKRCDKCAQFQPPDACKMVEGAISPQGSCRIFTAKPGST